MSKQATQSPLKAMSKILVPYPATRLSNFTSHNPKLPTLQSECLPASHGFISDLVSLPTLGSRSILAPSPRSTPKVPAPYCPATTQSRSAAHNPVTLHRCKPEHLPSLAKRNCLNSRSSSIPFRHEWSSFFAFIFHG